MQKMESQRVPLLENREGEKTAELGLVSRVWEESKKLWGIVGPAICFRLSSYGMNVTTQAFAGHLGDLELASISIANTVVSGFNYSLLLGMASALETLCGQAYGAKKYHMLGVYLQRSWIVLLLCAVLLLPTYFLAAPVLRFLGEPAELARAAGEACVWFIPQHFAFAMLFPLNRFLQSQLKNAITAYVSALTFVVHVFVSWLVVGRFKLGVEGAALCLSFSWWITFLGEWMYVACGACPHSWKGFSMEAFSDLWEFIKLSAASGVMLCLENWYYKILILLTGSLRNAKIAVDALSICMSINEWEMMIPLSFFAGTGVRVANELGAGNGSGAKFATIVAVVTSSVIGLFFWSLILAFHGKFALIYTSSTLVLKAIDKLSVLLAFTILLNSVQPILSGVTVGSGWQSIIAYVNIGTYYFVGIPIGILLGSVLRLGVLGIWAGMIGGTTIQTLILTFLIVRCDWNKEAMKASMRMKKERDSR